MNRQKFHTRRFIVKIVKVSAIPMMAAALASCHMTNPEYTALIDQVQTNAKRNDIVGSWYTRNQSSNMMVNMSTESVTTFYPNGTATVKANYKGRAGVMAMPQENEGTFKWSYQGNGVWESSAGLGHKATWRLAKGKLLVESKASTGGLGNFVNRMVYVRAGDRQAVDDAFRKDSTTQDSAWGL